MEFSQILLFNSKLFQDVTYYKYGNIVLQLPNFYKQIYLFLLGIEPRIFLLRLTVSWLVRAFTRQVKIHGEFKLIDTNIWSPHSTLSFVSHQ